MNRKPDITTLNLCIHGNFQFRKGSRKGEIGVKHLIRKQVRSLLNFLLQLGGYAPSGIPKLRTPLYPSLCIMRTLFSSTKERKRQLIATRWLLLSWFSSFTFGVVSQSLLQHPNLHLPTIDAKCCNLILAVDYGPMRGDGSEISSIYC